MKTLSLFQKFTALAIGALVLFSFNLEAATFTAVASGDYNSSATWGGTSPPNNISSDQVIVPVGLTVTLNNDVVVNGNTASLSVQGNLNTNSNASLIIKDGTVTGAGTYNLDSVAIESGATFAATGSVILKSFLNAKSGLSIGTNLDVSDKIYLMSGSMLNLATGGVFSIGNDATIVVESGGGLAASNGTISFSGDYNLMYTGGSATMGDETSGSSLNNLSIDVGLGEQVTMTSDLMVAGMLNAQSGSLELDGNKLTITGDFNFSSDAQIESDANASIEIDLNSEASSSIVFESNANTVNEFDLNIDSGGKLMLGSDLMVDNSFIEVSI